MTPRENMIRTIEFRRPQRLAISGHGDLSDCTGVYYPNLIPPQAQGDPALDQWCCRWERPSTPTWAR